MTPRAKRRLVLSLLFLAIVATAAAVFLARSPSFQIAYHRFQMQRAWYATFAKPERHADGLVGYALGESYERYKYHRQELVRLNAVRELQYSFNHLRTATDQGRHFSKLLFSPDRPECIDFESPYKPGELIDLTVWCFSQYADAWDRFIAEHDVPDYELRFMKLDSPGR